jgi:hypothetical protein
MFDVMIRYSILQQQTGNFHSLFPEPVRPTTPTLQPLGTENEAPSSARGNERRYRTARSLTSIAPSCGQEGSKSLSLSSDKGASDSTFPNPKTNHLVDYLRTLSYTPLKRRS